MKILNIILKALLCLLLLMPILGVLGVLPEPTAEMYGNPEAFAFIQALFATGYIVYLQAIVFAASIILIILNRTALAALLILPITVNIVGFHLFLDGGLFTPGAVPADILLLLNVYFLWSNRARYKSLWEKGSGAKAV